jgi:hypothetical protein
MNAKDQLVRRIKIKRQEFKKVNNPILLPEPLRGRGFLTRPFRYENILFLIIEKSKNNTINAIGSIEDLLIEFPNLISTSNEESVAFRLGGNGTYLVDCTVSNTHAFHVGNDSTTIVKNLKVIGTKNYVISLAYIIGFGSTIIDGSMSPLLDTLVDRSFSIWSK